jgi:hypothetical protein
MHTFLDKNSNNRRGEGRREKGRGGEEKLRVNGHKERAGLVPALIRAMCMYLCGPVQNPLL